MIDCRAMRFAVSVALWASFLWSCTGCSLFRQVKVDPIATSFQKPSNVGAYVAVRDGDEPLTELTSANFHVYENEQLVPAEQTQLTLLDRNIAVAHHALLLMDMSGAATPEARSQAAKGASNFVERLLPHQSVSVFAFDGSEGLVQIASATKGSAPPSMAALESFTPRDSSRNLNGAVLAALGKLDAQLNQAGKVVKVGMLVVYAGGPDVAGRADGDKAHDAVWESPHDVIAIGVAEQTEALEQFAKRGVVRAQAANTLPIAFEEAAGKVHDELEKYYLVSYCSPARAGSRRLRLEVKYTNKEGEEHSGDFEVDFDAKGFRPGCNPQQTPRFVVQPKEKPKHFDQGPAPTDDDAQGKPNGPKGKPGDSREHDQGEDAPVPPPDQGGYAK
jgi:hypothetical protein